MPPLRFLCLHGAGSSAELGPLMRELSKDNSAEFVFIDGGHSCEPGPGVADLFEPPYYSFYSGHRGTNSRDNESIKQAYDTIQDALVEEGPFDGLLGFSLGGTVAFDFLVHYAKTDLHEPLQNLVRCAVFICSVPPFRQDDASNLAIENDMDGYMDIPTAVIAGQEDFVYEHTLELAKLCNPGPSQLVVHSKGHEIPRDSHNVTKMALAVRKLVKSVMFL